MSFVQKMNMRRRHSHKGHICECWDCIRADGLTPPRNARKHYTCRYQGTTVAVHGRGVDTPGDPRRGKGGLEPKHLDYLIKRKNEAEKKEKKKKNHKARSES